MYSNQAFAYVNNNCYEKNDKGQMYNIIGVDNCSAAVLKKIFLKNHLLGDGLI